MDSEVLIVGSGPTGLMLANQLVRRGIKPMIIDRHSGLAQQTRAMAVQARTLEIYSKMGLADTALALGHRTPAANMWANGRWAARIPLGDIGQSLSPFPFVLMLGQDDNERIMNDMLECAGVSVRWNTELVALEQHPDHVAATLKLPDGSIEPMTVAWVAGCDGARSAVRELSGIAFAGAPYEHTFFVADTEAVGPMRPGELNVYLWRDGFHLFFPMRGTDRWRVIGILPKSLRDKDGVTFEDVVPSIKQEAGIDLTFKKCSWFSTYRIHHRAAETFRKGRCFLLGDAAHIHSPMGGQGMNTGLQDAYNLAWKLALVARCRADRALLDSYAAEREPVAEALLKTTDRAFQFVVSDSAIAGLLRTRIIARVAATAMRLDRVRTLAFRTIAQIGIGYPESPLSQTLGDFPGSAPKAGDRFPWMNLVMRPGAPAEDVFQALDDTRFNLLVIGQPAPSGLSGASDDLFTVHTVPADAKNDEQLARHSIPQPAYYLLRPDGHVGLCGRQMNEQAIRSYLADRLHLISK